MTKTYYGNGVWKLIFSDGLKITLTEKHILELVNEHEEMIYGNEEAHRHGKGLEEQQAHK